MDISFRVSVDFTADSPADLRQVKMHFAEAQKAGKSSKASKGSKEKKKAENPKPAVSQKNALLEMAFEAVRQKVGISNFKSFKVVRIEAT